MQLNAPINLSTGKYWLRVSPNFNNSLNLYRVAWSAINRPGNALFATPNTNTLGPIANPNNLGLAFNILGTFTGTATPPPTPTNLEAQAFPETRVVLSWNDNSTYTTSFIIERSNTSGSGFTQVGILAYDVNVFQNNLRAWIDNTGGLVIGNTYYYRVRAINALGESAYSNEASITIPGDPAIPANLRIAELDLLKTKLQWEDNVENEFNYQVLRSYISGKNYASIDILEANKTQSEISNINARDQEFFYVVRAFAPQGFSDFSNEVLVLSAPRELTAEISADGQTTSLAWRDISQNEEAYKIERSVFEDKDFEEIASTEANATSFTDNSIPAPQKYYYRVKAVSSKGFSPYATTEVDLLTSINSKGFERLKMYPNPTKEYFIIELTQATSKAVKVDILTVHGQAVSSQIVKSSPNSNNFRALFKSDTLVPGIYIIKINEGNKTTNLRLVITQ